jgi:hypothetical protein
MAQVLRQTQTPKRGREDIRAKDEVEETVHTGERERKIHESIGLLGKK